ncbi:MAG: hypothetical protein EP306_14200 [Burkholderiales bacterium]|nr:MAG: hypothetical protein EP306_14200 [Burkholderiales bacterium]
MNWFKILPGFQKSPPGLERVILRRLPRLFVGGTAALALVALLARWWPWSGEAADIQTRLTTLDIWLVSLAVLHWTVLLTVAIGAFIVMVMKGPAYVADAYHLPTLPPGQRGPREP